MDPLEFMDVLWLNIHNNSFELYEINLNKQGYYEINFFILIKNKKLKTMPKVIWTQNYKHSLYRFLQNILHDERI